MKEKKYALVWVDSDTNELVQDEMTVYGMSIDKYAFCFTVVENSFRTGCIMHWDELPPTLAIYDF